MDAGLGRTTGWQFQDVRVDVSAFRLTVNGEVRDLEPKSFRLLAFLIENRERALSKEEILVAVWNGAAVSDNALTRAVAQIRKAIGDDSRRPRYIETVPTVGYRFVAGVEPLSPADAPASDSVPEPAPMPQVPPLSPSLPPRTPASKQMVASLIGLAAAIGLIAWASLRHSDRVALDKAAAQAEKLAGEGKFAEAHSIATRVLLKDPANPRLLPLMSEITDVLTIRSTPAGAEVFVRRLDSAAEEKLGFTPLESRPIARGEYVLSLRKPGYAAHERSLSTRTARSRPASRMPWNVTLDVRLIPQAQLPAGMVLINATEHKLAAYSRPADAKLPLSAFFIDQFEVTNREFKQFVDAGAYGQSQFWKLPQVAASLKDKTGMNSPREWSGGAFPEGKANHPVTGLTWHEAYAYCQFRGKTLPTLFEWEEAGRAAMISPFGVIFPWGMGEGSEISARANFEGSGTTPVGAFPFGMSPHGVHDMAGNASEWLLNPYDNGYTTAGGGWSDPVYAFGLYQSRPALYQDGSLGFRCAAPAGASQNQQAAMAFSQKPLVLRYPVSSPAQFQASRERYRYPQSPLNAKVVAMEEKEAWRREEIEFDGYGGKRAKAFLYLPRNSAKPYQAIHYVGGSAWWMGVPVPEIVEDRAERMAPFIRSGRAVFLVVLEGFHGREPVGAYANLHYGSTQHKDILREWTVDMQRGMDYLLSRPDIDRRRIAFWNTSTIESGIVFAAVDGRYAATVLNGVGIREWLLRVPAEANALHFAPHISGPKLVLTGRYDEYDAHRVSTVDPVFNLLSGPKRHISYIGGHVPPNEIVVPAVNSFLDGTFGKITPP